MNKFPLHDFLKKYEKLFSLIYLILTISAIWTWYFKLYHVNNWKIPLGYEGDLWFGLAIARSYMMGYIDPFTYKFIPTLNAPFIANWNDYPITEDIIFAFTGYLARFIGLFEAMNFTLLVAHLLAGISFWWVCRELKYKASLSFAGAILYAFCHFIMSRGLGHVILSFFWHIPLLLLVTSWAFSNESIAFGSRKFVIASVVSFVCGLFNPYFTAMYLMFLFFASWMHASKKENRKLFFAIFLMGLTFISFFIVNANSIFYAFQFGGNPSASARNLASLEVYGMKLPELFLSPGSHPIQSFINYGQSHYYQSTYIKGEFWSPYLGLIGSLGVCLLALISIHKIMLGEIKSVSLNFWLLIFILLFSLIGGLNLLLGVLGFEFLRCTNRFSIFILTIALLFLIDFISKKSPSYLLIPISFILVFIGLAEELSGRFALTSQTSNPIETKIKSDKDFTDSIEAHSPGGLVFQMPVINFPEVGPVNNMQDYEHFRPYLYSKSLHFSYGTNKGRDDANWQKEIEKMPIKNMIKKLEEIGFSVIILNKKAYKDGGYYLINEFLRLNKKVIAENQDLIAISITPNKIVLNHNDLFTFKSYYKLQDIYHKGVPDNNFVYSDLTPYFVSGWSIDESTHRWATSSSAEILLFSYKKTTKKFHLDFELSSITPSLVKVYLNNKFITEINISKKMLLTHHSFPNLILMPGKNIMKFVSNKNPISPKNGDERLLTFKISNLNYD